MHKIVYLIKNPINGPDASKIRPVPEIYITSTEIMNQMKKWNWVDFIQASDGDQAIFDGKPIIVNDFIR